MQDEHLDRVRSICHALPGTEERLSHGEPTFFAGKRVFVMYSNNHHNDGHIAVWVPAPPGLQSLLIESEPMKYYRPAYVGVRGWIGIDLDAVDDDELTFRILDAWRMVAPKRLQALLPADDDGC